MKKSIVLFLLLSILWAGLVQSQEDVQMDLVVAVRADDAAGIRDAIAKGAELNAIGSGGQTPLVMAVLMGKLEAVKILMELKADPTIPEKDGYTVAHAAAFQGRADVLRALATDPSIDLNAQHGDGYHPIHRACWGREERHAQTVKAFLDLGISYDTPTRGGKTCMDILKHPETMRYLTEAKDRANQQEL